MQVATVAGHTGPWAACDTPPGVSLRTAIDPARVCPCLPPCHWPPRSRRTLGGTLLDIALAVDDFPNSPFCSLFQNFSHFHLRFAVPRLLLPPQLLLPCFLSFFVTASAMVCFIPVTAIVAQPTRAIAANSNSRSSPSFQSVPLRYNAVSAPLVIPKNAFPRSRHSSGGPTGGGGAGRRGDGSDSSGDGSFIHTVLAPLLSIWARYNNALIKAPLLTKSLSAAVLVCLSDVCAQLLSSFTSMNTSRLLRFALYGLCMTGPMGHFWFLALDRIVTASGPAAVLKKVLLDQLLFAPVATALFFATMKFADGKSLKDISAFLKNNLPTTLLSSYKVWPIANVINFAFVPSAYRVVFTSAVSVVWISFLSLVAGPSETPELQSS